MLGLGLALAVGFGALLFGGRGGSSSSSTPIGTPVAQIVGDDDVLTVRRHGQGFAWYLMRAGKPVASSNESTLRDAMLSGLESMAASGALNFGLVPPVGNLGGRVQERGGLWAWTIYGGDDGLENSRAAAVLRLVDALEVNADAGPVPPIPPLEGAIQTDASTSSSSARVVAGLAVSADCTRADVRDLDRWLEVAAPLVADAMASGEIANAAELAGVVFDNAVGCDTIERIDGRPWSPDLVEALEERIEHGGYASTVPAEVAFAAALVGRVLPPPPQGATGITGGWAWVVSPGPGGGWLWWTWDGPQGLHANAAHSGTASSVAGSRAKIEALIAEGGGG